MQKIVDHVFRLSATTNDETTICVGRIDFSPTADFPLQNAGIQGVGEVRARRIVNTLSSAIPVRDA